MQIEEDTHDDFHRTDLEGGDEKPDDGPEEAAAAAEAPTEGEAMMEGDDDYKADAPAEYEPESEDEDKKIISSAYFENTTVKDQKYYIWDRGFERVKPGTATIGMWSVIILLSTFGGLCIAFGTNDKATLENKYTQYHLKMNTGMYFSFAGGIFFGWSMWFLRSLGKFDNKILRMIVEPFLVLFRLAAIGALAYFVIYRLFITDFLLGCFFACSRNWWAKKTDPWITNASYLNAIISWPVFFMGCVYMLYISIGILALLYHMLTCQRSFCRALRRLPKNFWLFLRGLDERQYEFNLDQKCPQCNTGFTLDSKIGIMSSDDRWYKRECLAKKIREDIDSGVARWVDDRITYEEEAKEDPEDAAAAEGPEDAAAAEGPEDAAAAEGPEDAAAAEGPEDAAAEAPAE